MRTRLPILALVVASAALLLVVSGVLAPESAPVREAPPVLVVPQVEASPHPVATSTITAVRASSRSTSMQVRRGVRGRVRSSRAPSGDAVREGACLVRADGIARSRSLTTYEVGLGGEVRLSADGAFDLPLAPGLWRVVIIHFPLPEGEPHLVEVWNTTETIAADATDSVDLGVVHLPESVIRGTVRRPDGGIIDVPIDGSTSVRVTYSDQYVADDGALLGADFFVPADPEGRFAIAWGRSGGTPVVGVLRASFGRAHTERRQVMPGDLCSLILDVDAIPPRLDVVTTLMVAEEEGTLRLWTDAWERPVTVPVAELRANADGLRTFTLRTPPRVPLHYEWTRRESDGTWRVAEGTLTTAADGLPLIVEPVWTSARAVVGRADGGRMRRGRALPGGRVVVLDETSVGEDGWFRFDGVTREECLLVGAAGRLQIPASEAASTDVGDLRGLSGGAK